MPETSRDEIARLQEEYAQDPDGRLFVHLAEAYRRTGELERARELLEQGLQQHSDYLSARILLAEVHGELGEEAQARQAWQEVITRDPESERALRALADLEYMAGHGREALRYYRQLQQLGIADEEVRGLVQELETATMDAAAPRADRGESTDAKPAPAVASAPASPAPAARKDEARPAARPTPAPAVQETLPPRPPQTDAIALTDLLVRLLEHRDATFHAESSLTRLLALSIGRELELDAIHLDALALAALLSDLGGVALTDHRREIVTPGEESEAAQRGAQREVAISLQLLQGITLPQGVHEAVRHQHERWDGTGYPDGLRDEEIPYGARVLSIARACAGLLTHRADRPARSVTAALDELQRHAGTHFDPVVVNVLRRVFQRRAEHGIGFGVGGRVTIIHPEELRTLSLGIQLHTHGYVTEMDSEVARVRESLRTTPTRALVVGAKLPGGEVLRLIREVRSTAAVAHTPIIVIDANDLETRVDYLTAGADICFPSEVTFKEFMATLVALLRRTEEGGTAAGPRSVDTLA